MEPSSPQYSDDFEETLSDEFAQTSTSTFFGADSDEEVATLRVASGLGRKNSDTSVCTGSTATPSEEVGQVDRQSQQKELLTDEGRELDEALREAQQALEVARQFVNSPSLCERAPALLRQTSSEAEAPSQPPRRKKSRPPAGAAKAEASVFASQGAAAGLMGDLPGEAAARARVRRAKSMEVANRLRQEAEAAAKEAERASLVSVMEAQRRRAARRASSEQRALRAARRQEEQLKRLQERRSQEQQALGLRSAKSASRRVESERCRRQDLAREVLLSLHAEQAARREVGRQQGGELAQRTLDKPATCTFLAKEIAKKDSDFSHCRPVVESRWRRQKSRSCSEPPERESSLRLPPIAPAIA